MSRKSTSSHPRTSSHSPSERRFRPARLALAGLAAGLAFTAGAAAALDPWPATASESTKFNCFNQSYFEPSGAVPQGSWLYVVSDNSQIGRQTLASDQNCIDNQGANHFDSQVLPASSKKAGDYEAIAAVPGKSTLYLGVEGNGGDVPHARIVEYQPVADDQRLKDKNAASAFTGKVWVLTDLPIEHKPKRNDPTKFDSKGMEAMTFVPDGDHPHAKAGAPFNGLFYAASQASSADGQIYVFKLGASGAVSKIAQFAVPTLSESPSDLYFSPGEKRLYALYDEGEHRLQVLKLSGTTWVQEKLYAPQFGTSKTSSQMKGMEAVAVSSSGDLYIGLDQARSQATDNGSCRATANGKCTDWLNPVYRYHDF